MVIRMRERQANRLPAYDYSKNGAYFVTICTQDRKHILAEIVGDGFPVPKLPGRVAEEMIRQIPIKYAGVFVDKYIVMPDHIHLLLRMTGTGNPSPTLGSVVGWYKYQTTKAVNQAESIQGMRIFQRSYHDHVIRNQQDYDEIWEYIENNPKAWVIKKQGSK